MTQPTAEEQALAHEAVRLAGILPEIEGFLAKMQRAVEVRTLIALDKGLLTPDQALYAWMEVGTLRKLLGKFKGPALAASTLTTPRAIAHTSPLPLPR